MRTFLIFWAVSFVLFLSTFSVATELTSSPFPLDFLVVLSFIISLVVSALIRANMNWYSSQNTSTYDRRFYASMFIFIALISVAAIASSVFSVLYSPIFEGGILIAGSVFFVWLRQSVLRYSYEENIKTESQNAPRGFTERELFYLLLIVILANSLFLYSAYEGGQLLTFDGLFRGAALTGELFILFVVRRRRRLSLSSLYRRKPSAG